MVVRQKEGRSIGRFLFVGRDQSFANLYLKNPKLDITRPAYEMAKVMLLMGDGEGLQGTMGSRGKPTGSQWVKG